MSETTIQWTQSPPSVRRFTGAEDVLVDYVGRGIFEIDPSGRVWRVGIMRRGSPIPCTRRRAENGQKGGYLQVRLMVDGHRHYASAHRLVYRHFFGPIPAGLVINHRNGVKHDNRPSNLEAVTYSENTKHAHRHRLIDQRGRRNHQARLSDADVRRIRERRAEGEALATIAHDFGVREQHISRLARGERRLEAGGPITLHDRRRDAWRRMSRCGVTGQFTGVCPLEIPEVPCG